MKSRMRVCLWVGVVSGFFPVAGYGQSNFAEGIVLDENSYSTFLGPNVGTLPNRDNLQLTAPYGGLYLLGGEVESTRGEMDGGVTVAGNPISLVLYGNNTGSFSVWGGTQYWSTSGAQPYFKIDSATQEAIFDGVAVKVANGSLSVGGSPVVTTGEFNAALATSTPPTSTAWTSAYLQKGNVSNGAALATGAATASGASSMAHGLAQTVASGDYSFALGSHAIASGYGAFSMGWNSRATGQYSSAHGDVVTASGVYSDARGYYSSATGMLSSASGVYAMAHSYAETVIGRYNRIDASPTANNWIASDALFRIGNGTDVDTSERSDAVTVRKNGETTLTNKAWKDANLGLAEPTDPGAAGGKALVVDGHTLLNGKVTMAEAQGDISMGIYQ
jgi:hypothetical protein